MTSIKRYFVFLHADSFSTLAFHIVLICLNGTMELTLQSCMKLFKK